jgi:hypothetical protein
MRVLCVAGRVRWLLFSLVVVGVRIGSWGVVVVVRMGEVEIWVVVGASDIRHERFLW